MEIDPPTTDPTPTDAPLPPDDDPLRQYRRWATVLFVVLALVGIVGAVVVLSVADTVPTSTVLQLLGTVVLGTGVMVIVVLALGRGEAWAVHSIVPLCTVIIAAGLIRVIMALASSRIDIPLDVIGALMVLTRPHPASSLPSLDQAGERTRSVAVGAFIVAQVVPYLSTALTS